MLVIRLATVNQYPRGTLTPRILSSARHRVKTDRKPNGNRKANGLDVYIERSAGSYGYRVNGPWGNNAARPRGIGITATDGPWCPHPCGLPDPNLSLRTTLELTDSPIREPFAGESFLVVVRQCNSGRSYRRVARRKSSEARSLRVLRRTVTVDYLVDPASSICSSQRLSHACLSTSRSKVKPRTAH